MKEVKKWFRLNIELVSLLWKKNGNKVKLENNEIISAISCRFLVFEKYVVLQICDDEDVETMLEIFQQQNQMSILEFYVSFCKFSYIMWK